MPKTTLFQWVTSGLNFNMYPLALGNAMPVGKIQPNRVATRIRSNPELQDESKYLWGKGENMDDVNSPKNQLLV